MYTKNNYINLIRWSCILDSFANHYFIRVIVLYLLSQNVTPWVAVSIPIVLEFAKLVSCSIELIGKLALKINYKKYSIFHLLSFLILGLFICQCRNIYMLYLFTIIIGVISGIKVLSITKLNTSNKSYEPYCFIEQERATVIGGASGLIVSQFIYDMSHKVYIYGYIFILIISILISMFLKQVPDNDVMIPIMKDELLTKEEKKKIIMVSLLFGVLVGLWCMGLSAFEELAPLISNKIGYLNAVYMVLEVLLLCIISGSILRKIRNINSYY